MGNKAPQTIHQLIENMAMNSYQWNTHEKKKVTGFHEVDAVTSLATQVKLLSKKIDTLCVQRGASVMHCEGYGEGHSQNDCPIAIGSSGRIEQVGQP